MLLTLVFNLAFYPLIGTLCSFWSFSAYSMMAAWHVSAWAILISIVFDEKSAQLLLIVFCLVSLLCAGVSATKKACNSNFHHGHICVDCVAFWAVRCALLVFRA